MTRIRKNAEIGVFVALAVVLGTLTRFIQLPFGGSINLSLLPIVVLALRRGSRVGLLSGTLYGLVDFVLNPFFYHPAQVLLDYPMASGCMAALSGLATCFKDSRYYYLAAAIAMAAAGIGRLFFHWLSGVLFFASYAPQGEPVWLYSLTYNSSYVIPETVLCILLSQLLLRYLSKSSYSTVTNRS